MAALASSAVFTWGTTMPWAPDSTAERMRKTSLAPTLTSGVSPDTSAARIRCTMVSGLVRLCSMSSITKSKPV